MKDHVHSPSPPSDAKQPVDWVDPLIDTANRRFFYLTTASRPFGLVNLSPDTRVGENAWRSGYRYNDEHIHWFSHVHAWQLCGVPMMPTHGAMRGHEGSDIYKSRFSHDSETAEPGYHAVYLDDYAIHAELSASVRVGLHRYRFDRAGQAWILLDLPASIMLPMSDCQIEQHTATEFSGFVENAATLRRPKASRIYFVLHCEQPPEELQYWKDGEQVPSPEGSSGAGIALGYQVSEGEVLRFRIGLSYCGVEQARENIRRELTHWDLDRLRAEAREDWNEHLSRIEVDGGTEAQTTKFYTDLFHALKGRRRVSDAQGTYMDQTGEAPRIRQIPLDASGQPSYEHHNSDAFWGSIWTLNSLWPLAWPEITHNFCNTLVDMYRNGGLIPRGPSGGNYTFVMTSPTSTPFLVAAWMYGVRSFDIHAAYEGMLKNHGPGGLMSKAGYEHHSCVGGGVEYYLERGYVPQGIEAEAMHTHAAATMTLEYAFHDWALAQLALEQGHAEDAQHLLKRSEQFINLWDPETRFMRPREMDGSFSPDFDPMAAYGWEEGNAHHYRWHVPHNVPKLIELFGGPQAFIEELDNLFLKAEAHDFIAPHGYHEQGYIDYGNQPCTYLAHLFTYAGAPALTQKWTQRVMAAAKSDISPYSGYGGDEDQGQMGALNALMSMGLFSVTGGCEREPTFELTRPFFDHIRIQLSERYHGGGHFVIQCNGNGPGERYIQAARLNGEDLTGPFLAHQDIRGGSCLEIDLGMEPHPSWGCAPGSNE